MSTVAAVANVYWTPSSVQNVQSKHYSLFLREVSYMFRVKICGHHHAGYENKKEK